MSNSHNINTGEYIPETYVPHAESHGTKSLWRTFWVLLFITILDFIIYFAAPHGMGRNLVFIALGLVKAVLIVGIFMHLNYEAKFMRLMIVIPSVVLITYFVILLLIEGGYISAERWT